MSTAEVAVRQSSAIAVQDELTIAQLVDQVQLIQQAMEAVMKRGEHYGTIPGAGSKQVLFKAGAEKLCLLFRLDPEYDVVESYHDDGHYTARVTCKLSHVTTGNRMGSGVGLCTSKEKKYAFRKGQPNMELPDTYNTVLKMACKRALVAAVLNTTGASDIFTQDLEDVSPAQEPLVLASDAKLAELGKMLDLVSYAPELWGHEAVCAAASRRFGRAIGRLADLQETEADAVIKGAQQYWTDNPPAATDAKAEEDAGGLDMAALQAAQKAGKQEAVVEETVDGEAVEIDWPGEVPA